MRRIDPFATKPYLDGMYLLKIGKDIRISPQMMSGLNVPTNFTFKISFSNQFNRFSGSTTCQFTTVAFFPAFYQISPTEGLLRTQNITVSEKEMLEMVNVTNDDIGTGKFPNNVKYTHEYPLMVGSGWFGALTRAVPRSLSSATNARKSVVSVVKNSSSLGRGRIVGFQ